MRSNVIFDYYEIKDVGLYSMFTSNNAKNISIVWALINNIECYSIEYNRETTVYAHIIYDEGLEIVPIHAITNKWGSYDNLDFNHEYVIFIINAVKNSMDFLHFCNNCTIPV